MRGLILFAHGARDPRWAQPFEQTAKLVRERQPGRPVLTAFLEFMSPDLAAAGQQLAEAGCSSVDVLPLFLGSGGHVRKDLPAKVQALRDQWPQVSWTLQPAIGESPLLLDAMARIATELPDTQP
jgi:sirohydrochlorin cobaltochelatase